MRFRLLQIAFFGVILCWASLAFFQADGRQTDWPEVKTIQCPIGMFARDKSEPGDRIFVWGFAAPIYTCAGRLPAARFIQADPLVGRISGQAALKIDAPPLVYKTDRVWGMLFEDFGKHSPKIIVDTSGMPSSSFDKFPIENYPIGKWMDMNGYRETARIRGARFFEIGQ